MKKYSLAAILGGAILVVVPASALTTDFVFTNTVSGTMVSTYSASYGGVTANLYAYSVTGSSTGPGTTGSSSDLTPATIGEWGSNGLGICEAAGGGSNDCGSPNHQVNNGNETNATSSGTDYFEFMLFQFTGGTVNLQNMLLGNFGTEGTTSDPFNATYWTYTANTSLATLQGQLATTTVAGLGALGFSAATPTDCAVTTGTTCGINASPASDTLTVSGTNSNNVTYLLFGASILQSQVATDYFKIQDLNVSSETLNQTVGTPEPATFGLLGLALAGLGAYGRKRKANRS